MHKVTFLFVLLVAANVSCQSVFDLPNILGFNIYNLENSILNMVDAFLRNFGIDSSSFTRLLSTAEGIPLPNGREVTSSRRLDPTRLGEILLELALELGNGNLVSNFGQVASTLGRIGFSGVNLQNGRISLNVSELGILLREFGSQFPNDTVSINLSNLRRLGWNIIDMLNLDLGQLGDSLMGLGSVLPSGILTLDANVLDTILRDAVVTLQTGSINLDANQLGVLLNELGAQLPEGDLVVHPNQLGLSFAGIGPVDTITLNVSQIGNDFISLGSRLSNGRLNLDTRGIEQILYFQNDSLNLNVSQLGIVFEEFGSQLHNSSLSVNPSRFGSPWNLPNVAITLNLHQIGTFLIGLGSQLPYGSLKLTAAELNLTLNLQNSSLSVNASQIGVVLREIGSQLPGSSLRIDPRQLGFDINGVPWYIPNDTVILNLRQLGDSWIELGSQLPNGILTLDVNELNQILDVRNGNLILNANRIGMVLRGIASQLRNMNVNEPNGATALDLRQLGDYWTELGSTLPDGRLNLSASDLNRILNLRSNREFGIQSPNHDSLPGAVPDQSQLGGHPIRLEQEQPNIVNPNSRQPGLSRLGLNPTNGTTGSVLYAHRENSHSYNSSTSSFTILNSTNAGGINSDFNTSSDTSSEQFNSGYLLGKTDPSTNCESLYNITQTLVDILNVRTSYENSTGFESLFSSSQNLSNVLSDCRAATSHFPPVYYDNFYSMLNRIVSILIEHLELDSNIYESMASIVRIIEQVLSQSPGGNSSDWNEELTRQKLSLPSQPFVSESRIDRHTQSGMHEEILQNEGLTLQKLDRSNESTSNARQFLFSSSGQPMNARWYQDQRERQSSNRQYYVNGGVN